MNLRKLAGYLLIPFCFLLISACSSSGGGDDTPNPTNGSNWDQMQWDNGSWS